MKKTTKTWEALNNIDKYSVLLRVLCASVVSVSLFMIPACNIPKDGEQENIPTSRLEALTMLGNEDSTKIKDSVAATTSVNELNAMIEKPILIARGSEPGWYAEFFTDRLRLLVENGTDSLKINHDFSRMPADKVFQCTITEKAVPQLRPLRTFTLQIQIETKLCTEAGSGKNRDRSITIQFNGKTYKGCAYSE